MAEHQILKLRPDDLEAFEQLFTQLNLKRTGRELAPAVLKEGYSTAELVRSATSFAAGWRHSSACID